MLQIVNGTQHEITIYSPDDTIAIQSGRKLILREGAKPVLVIPPGTNLNCVKGNASLPEHLADSGIPLKGAVKFLSHDEVPEGNIVVVSNLYRSAVKELGYEGDTSRLATVDGTVYESESAIRPCGCTGLAVG